MFFCEIIIRDKRGSGAEYTGDFKGASKETSEPGGGVFGGVFLIIRGFMGFVDDDKTKVFNGGEKGGTRADDDLFMVTF